MSNTLQTAFDILDDTLVEVEGIEVEIPEPQEPYEPTHGELVMRAARWLKNTRKCGVVFTEPRSFQAEIPDAIGFMGPDDSIVVECKATRSDFQQDGKKHFRINPEQGMGDRRYYMAPPGIIRVEELPELWGLLECRRTYVRVVQYAGHQPSKYRDSIRRHETRLWYYQMYGVQNYGKTTLEGSGLPDPCGEQQEEP